MWYTPGPGNKTQSAGPRLRSNLRRAPAGERLQLVIGQPPSVGHPPVKRQPPSVDSTHNRRPPVAGEENGGTSRSQRTAPSGGGGGAATLGMVCSPARGGGGGHYPPSLGQQPRGDGGRRTGRRTGGQVTAQLRERPVHGNRTGFAQSRRRRSCLPRTSSVPRHVHWSAPHLRQRHGRGLLRCRAVEHTHRPHDPKSSPTKGALRVLCTASTVLPPPPPRPPGSSHLLMGWTDHPISDCLPPGVSGSGSGGHEARGPAARVAHRA